MKQTDGFLDADALRVDGGHQTREGEAPLQHFRAPVALLQGTLN
jgi:hypothetical protein